MRKGLGKGGNAFIFMMVRNTLRLNSQLDDILGHMKKILGS